MPFILAIVAVLSLLINLLLVAQNQRNFKRNFTAEYRPYVFMEKIDAHFEEDGVSKYDFKAINRGKTPAKITSGSGENPDKDKIIGPGQTLILSYSLNKPKNHIMNFDIYYIGVIPEFKDKEFHSSFKITHTYGQKPAIVSSTFN